MKANSNKWEREGKKSFLFFFFFLSLKTCLLKSFRNLIQWVKRLVKLGFIHLPKIEMWCSIEFIVRDPYLCVGTNYVFILPLCQEQDARQSIFKWSLNSVFLLLTKAKEPSQLYYLPLAGKWTDGFMPYAFPKSISTSSNINNLVQDLNLGYC